MNLRVPTIQVLLHLIKKPEYKILAGTFAEKNYHKNKRLKIWIHNENPDNHKRDVTMKTYKKYYEVQQIMHIQDALLMMKGGTLWITARSRRWGGLTIIHNYLFISTFEKKYWQLIYRQFPLLKDTWMWKWICKSISISFCIKPEASFISNQVAWLGLEKKMLSELWIESTL